MVNEFQKLLELQADSIADVPLLVPFEVTDRSMLPDDFPLETKENEPKKIKKFSRQWVKKVVTGVDPSPVEYTTQIVIEPQKAGTVFRLIPLIAKIKQEDMEKVTVNTERDFDEAAPALIGKYGDIIIQAICLGIHNRKGPYPEYMPEFLRENCTWKDLHFFLNSILFRMGTIAFTKSTTMLMKVGPGAEETIALQKANLESHLEEETVKN